MIRWLYNNYALTGIISFYYMVLIGYGTYQVFSQVTLINGASATVYGALMGLPAAAMGMIKWRLGADNAEDDQ